MMVKEEEIITEAGGRGYLDMVGLGDEDFFRGLSPISSSSVVSAVTTGSTPATASSPTCVSYMGMAPRHHMLNFTGQEQYNYDGNGPFGLQYNAGDHAIPVVVPQKSSPTTECSSSISSMSSSPTVTSISAISSKKPQAFKKKGARCGGQRKAAAAAAATNKKPRVRRERLGERIIALQQLVSPFGKSDTATVLHEALGYIRFLHDQVQVLSSPYMNRLPGSAHATVQEGAAGTVVEPAQRRSDLRSRGLWLVPISCMDHFAGDGHSNGADLWSVAVPSGVTNVTASRLNKGAAAMLPGGGHNGRLD